jgi:hypothetical protein
MEISSMDVIESHILWASKRIITSEKRDIIRQVHIIIFHIDTFPTASWSNMRTMNLFISSQQKQFRTSNHVLTSGLICVKITCTSLHTTLSPQISSKFPKGFNSNSVVQVKSSK